MGRDRSSDRWCELGEPPSEARITVFPDPHGRGLPGRLLAHSGIGVLIRTHGLFVFVVVVAIAAMTAIVASGGGGAARQRANPWVREPGATGVATAYGYPARCLSVTISAIDPAFARADFDHARECG